MTRDKWLSIPELSTERKSYKQSFIDGRTMPIPDNILVGEINLKEIGDTRRKLLGNVFDVILVKRNDKDFVEMDTPRGIICQIQISTSIYSDFCSLLRKKA